MPATVPTGLALDDLARALRGADPAALLVPPRILRRVIKHDRHVHGVGFQVAHRKTYVISRDRLLKLVRPQELGLANADDWPGTLLLIGQPDAERQAGLPREATLLASWQLLFHARLDASLEARRADGTLSDAVIADRVARIGPAAFAEIGTVLTQERMLLPPIDAAATYLEFAAVYLELCTFAPGLRAFYFPGILDFDAIDALLCEDVDAAAILAATRPAGAPEPTTAEASAGDEAADAETTNGDLPFGAEPAAYQSLMSRADDVAARGNLVRAAILRMRAADSSAPGRDRPARAAAANELHRLGHRLRQALDLDAAATKAWRRVLPALLPAATNGAWPPAARLLYDLQKVCSDHERPMYRLDLPGWIASFGRRPLKRPLPCQQEVLKLKHLRKALQRLPSVPLVAPDRRRLAGLLQSAIADDEQRIQARFRPILLAALEAVGLVPANYPERVARDKLVQELLERITERGFTTMSDLRDALSRNQLKLPDLRGPGEFLAGDPLLLLDRRLADDLEGVHRRGEVYLRWLQRFSSAFFGTRIGRFLTLYVALPFGGAFFVLEALQHVVDPVMKLVVGHPIPPVEPTDEAVPPEVREAANAPLHLFHWYTWLPLGFFFLALLHVPPFRQRVGRALAYVGRGLKLLFIDAPGALLRLSWLQRLFASDAFQTCVQFGFKPLFIAFLLSLEIPLLGGGHTLWGGAVAGLFVAFAVLLNTRWGRDIEEMYTDHLQYLWHRVSFDVVPNIFNFVVGFFRQLLEFIDRALYTVDEWMRFRGDEGPLSLVLKPILGLIWAGVSYVIRFCINLLIEPQANPIKHFPVVTVSHKLVLTMIVPPAARILSEALAISVPEALGIATLVGSLIPGIFGFLVWELKENWKLYRSNRAAALRPVAVGSHGETMARLLRPGFHSGTLPKLFSRLRKAARSARRRDRWVAFRKQRDALHHVETDIRHFLEREFLRLLAESPSWNGPPPRVGHLGLATNVIRVELLASEVGPEPFGFRFREEGGELSVELTHAGWLPRLSPCRRRTLLLALAGLFPLSAVDRMRGSVAGHAKSTAIAEESIAWPWWVDAWELDQAGKEVPAAPTALYE